MSVNYIGQFAAGREIVHVQVEGDKILCFDTDGELLQTVVEFDTVDTPPRVRP